MCVKLLLLLNYVCGYSSTVYKAGHPPSKANVNNVTSRHYVSLKNWGDFGFWNEVMSYG